ncbi:kinase suppressor of Ras 1-like isoform X2 [Symphalangus syndactylus]|uniref:kinase suppressor of Ras 1-like isoform X2 n=1 Tax=Symphalangus syndactylus TaxID=9590 RepID=UPI003003D125
MDRAALRAAAIREKKEGGGGDDAAAAEGGAGSAARRALQQRGKLQKLMDISSRRYGPWRKSTSQKRVGTNIQHP